MAAQHVMERKMLHITLHVKLSDKKQNQSQSHLRKNKGGKMEMGRARSKKGG